VDADRMMIASELRDGPVIELRLLWPPSVNSIWRNVVVNKRPRTLLSKPGRDWFAIAAGQVMQQRAGVRILGRAAVDLTLHAPDRRALATSSSYPPNSVPLPMSGQAYRPLREMMYVTPAASNRS
jgi:hypothetical protein